MELEVAFVPIMSGREGSIFMDVETYELNLKDESLDGDWLVPYEVVFIGGYIVDGGMCLTSGHQLLGCVREDDVPYAKRGGDLLSHEVSGELRAVIACSKYFGKGEFMIDKKFLKEFINNKGQITRVVVKVEEGKLVVTESFVGVRDLKG